jgi:AbrB family looped-hinge helix DNA binding protein
LVKIITCFTFCYKSTAEATLSSKNQIVIPREAREALQLKPGDKLLITAHAGKILILEKPKSYSKVILGRGRYPKDYLKKERQSWR